METQSAAPCPSCGKPCDTSWSTCPSCGQEAQLGWVARLFYRSATTLDEKLEEEAQQPSNLGDGADGSHMIAVPTGGGGLSAMAISLLEMNRIEATLNRESGLLIERINHRMFVDTSDVRRHLRCPGLLRDC